MKTIIRLFAAVLTAVPVLVSCYSEPLPEVIPEVIPEDEGNGSEQDATTRIITLSFDTKATRTVLSDETDYFSVPVFRPNDVIVVAQADGQAESQTFTLTEDNFVGGVATITTDLSGPLEAVYPASCADYDDDNSNKIIGVRVPSVQNGTFANANICMATQTETSNTLQFKNKTAVFVIKLADDEENGNYDEIGALLVSSLKKITTTNGISQRNGAQSIIANDPSDAYTIRLITDESHSYPNPLYVSVLCENCGDAGPVLLRDLNFDIEYWHNYFDEEEQDYYYRDVHAMGGFSKKFLAGLWETTVSAGKLYPSVENHLHEYCYGGRTYWSTMNIGAESVDDPGLFFMWGELEGHKPTDGTGFSFPNTSPDAGRYTYRDPETSQSGWNASSGFALCNAPFSMGVNSSTGKDSYSKYTDKNSVTLSLDDDAAFYNWGGGWRLPTASEATTLNGAGYAVQGDYTYQSSNYYEYFGMELCFSSISHGEGLALIENSHSKYSPYSKYWTSSLYQMNKIADMTQAFLVRFIKNSNEETNPSVTTTESSKRYFGYPIRPVVGVDSGIGNL